jgi:hypothetical protein
MRVRGARGSAASGIGPAVAEKEGPAETVFSLASVVLPRGDGRLCVGTEDYRAKAREMREQARTAKDTSACTHLVVMAGQYDWLAEWIEAQLSGARPSKP